MGIIRLTESDLRKMVRVAVNSVLNESVNEVMGSAMADKEDAINGIVEHIEKWWYRNLENGTLDSYLEDNGTFKFKGEDDGGFIEIYKIALPRRVLTGLDLAENYDFIVRVKNYTFPEKYMKHIGFNERGTEGETFFAPEHLRLEKTTMKFKGARIELSIPAINGELQVPGIYNTLYHELNHTASNLEIGKKTGEGHNMFTATSKKPLSTGVNQHSTVGTNMNRDSFRDFLNRMRYGDDYETFQAINYLFYSIWEITERNARAEGMYGDLKALESEGERPTRKNFKELYPRTTVYNVIEQSKGLLKQAESLDSYSQIWDYVAMVLGIEDSKRGQNREAVKARFVNRTRDLIEQLYRKAMKVAALYFDRHNWQSQEDRINATGTKFGENGFDNK